MTIEFDLNAGAGYTTVEINEILKKHNLGFMLFNVNIDSTVRLNHKLHKKVSFRLHNLRNLVAFEPSTPKYLAMKEIPLIDVVVVYEYESFTHMSKDIENYLRMLKILDKNNALSRTKKPIQRSKKLRKP